MSLKRRDDFACDICLTKDSTIRGQTLDYFWVVVFARNRDEITDQTITKTYDVCIPCCRSLREMFRDQ